MLAAQVRERPGAGRLITGVLTVGTWTALARVAGAANVIAIARVYGASGEMDAFLFAFLAPSFFADVVAGSLTCSIVPVVTAVRLQHGEERAHRLSSGILAASTFVLLAIACAVLLGAHSISGLRGNHGAETRALTDNLLRLLTPLLPVTAILVCWRAFVNMHGWFALPAAAPVVTPLLTMALLFTTSGAAGVRLLCYATCAGALIEALLLAGLVRRLGYPLLPKWPGWMPEMGAVLRQYLPALAGTAITAGAGVIEQGFASRLPSGSLSAFSYGTKLTSVIVAVAGTALSTVALPQLSRLAAGRDWRAFRATFLRFSAVAVAVGTTAALALIAASGLLVRIMLQRGALSPADCAAVSLIQRCSLLQLPLAFVLTFAFVTASALRANRLILAAAPVAFAANVVFDLVLMRRFGAPGIAAAPAAADAIALITLCLLLYRLARATSGPLFTRF